MGVVKMADNLSKVAEQDMFDLVTGDSYSTATFIFEKKSNHYKIIALMKSPVHEITKKRNW